MPPTRWPTWRSSSDSSTPPLAASERALSASARRGRPAALGSALCVDTLIRDSLTRLDGTPDHCRLRDDLAMARTTSDMGPGLRGRFWLQGTPEGEAIPGRLFLEAGSHPLLELDEVLTPVTRETSRRKLADGREVVTSSLVPPQELAGQSLTIYGTLETGELVTLPSAFTAGWTERGAGYRSHRRRQMGNQQTRRTPRPVQRPRLAPARPRTSLTTSQITSCR